MTLPYGKMPDVLRHRALVLGLGGFVLVDVFHDIGYVALEDLAELIDRVGGDVVAMLHGVIGGAGETQLH